MAGDIEAFVGTIRDVSERVAREEHLERERDRLESFAGVVSHDLRNPLAVAQGRLELAVEESDNENLPAIGRALNRMDALIDDLLVLARAGETVGETEPVELSELVGDCWESVKTDAAALVVDTDGIIDADRSRLRQLVENLIRNAVEHAGEQVTITIGDLPAGFYVADDGPGIPEEDRDQVFETGFSTISDGTGFGFSNVKEIVTAHGWSIRVTEGSDGGARFEITDVDCR